MNLRLQDQLRLRVVLADGAGDGGGLCGGGGHAALLHLHAEGLHQVLALVLVQVQETHGADVGGTERGHALQVEGAQWAKRGGDVQAG